MNPGTTRFLVLLLALASGCAQVTEQSAMDGGSAGPPRVAEVDPVPGAIPATAIFHVAFSLPMDASLLLSDADHSETVALVHAPDAELVAAAMAHGKLTARVRALLVAARATIDAQALSLDLTPDQPLAARDFFLLVASRLKDAAGRKLEGNGARFGFTVAAHPQLPALIAPRAGSLAPLNLALVYVAVPAGAEATPLALAGPDGTLWTGVTPADGGTLAITLCVVGEDCAALRADASYALEFDGAAIPDAGFAAAPCKQSAAPALLSSAAAVRDDSMILEAVLDAPALAQLDVAALPSGQPAGDDDALLASLCAQGSCASAQSFTSCVRDACATADSADGGSSDPCAVTLQVGGLAAQTSYLFRVVATDAERHAVTAPALRFDTLAALPHVQLSEVMSWPPAPSPRSPGQYIELVNSGGAPVDLSALALRGADGKPRSLSDRSGTPIVLAPQGRALAVGGSFDPSRYPALPPEVPVLRATTQRLLGRGLREKSPAGFDLVLLQDGGNPILLDTFPGGVDCPDGCSLERLPPDPSGAAVFVCGAVGGSPGLPR